MTTANETPDIDLPDVTDAKALRHRAREKRREFARSPLSRFVREMQDVMRDYMKAREAGVSREDAVKGIEAVLRAVWPKRPSKFATCEGCDNSGWRTTTCTHGARCGRYNCSTYDQAWEHTFAVPCECSAGDRMRPKVFTPDAELATVGKSKPKKRGGFTRFGMS